MAVDFTQDDFRVYLDRVDALLHKFSGLSGSKSSRKSRSGGGYDEETGLFNRAVNATADSLKVLHGSADHASHALRDVVGFVGLGGALMSLISHVGDTTKTYGKLIDVGQTFGGSMFEMQKQAGDSGLTLELFAESVTKGSQVIARMSADQTKGIQDFNAYQKGVRSSLQLYGFYGMSLSDLTDATASYADTLRMTGQWEKMNMDQRKLATTNFIQNIQGFADVAGKSRDEMMKQAMDLANQPDMAAALADMTTKQAADVTAKLASYGADMGDGMRDMFADVVKYKGQIQFSPKADEYREAGLQGILDQMVQAYNTTMAGQQKVGSESFFDEQKRIIESLALDPRMQVGGQLQVTNPKMYAEVQAAIKSFRGLEDTAADAKRWSKAQSEAMEPVTRALILFKSNLELTTASFKKGFYDGIINSMLHGSTDINSFNDSLGKLDGQLEDFGKAAGAVFSVLIDVVPTLVEAFKILATVLDHVQSAFESILKRFGLGGRETLKWVQKKDGTGDELDKNGNRIPLWETDPKTGKDKIDEKTHEKVQARTESTNYAKIIGSTLTVGLTGYLGVLLKRRISGAMRMNANVVNLIGKKIVGAGGAGATGGETLGGDVVGGTTTQVTEEAKTGRLAALRKNPLRAAGKAFGGALAGLVGGQVINGVIDSLLPDSGVKTMAESVISWSAPIVGLVTNLGLLGPAFRGAWAGMKGMVGLGGSLISFISEFAVAMIPAIASAWSFTAALLANPITWVVAGIAALIAAGVELYEHWDWVQKQMGAVFDWFGDQSGWVQALLMALAPIIFVPLKIYQSWSGITGFFSNLWDEVKQSTADAWHPAQWVIDKSGDAVSSLFDIWGPLKPFFSGLWADITKQFDWAWKPIQAVIDEWKSVWNWIYGDDKPPVTGNKAPPTAPAEIKADATVAAAQGTTPPASAMADAMKDVISDPSHSFLTAPINEQTDTFEALNRRLLDTVALITIDRDKLNKGGADPKLDIEIQKAQLEQLQIQNALLKQGNNQRDDIKRQGQSAFNIPMPF